MKYNTVTFLIKEKHISIIFNESSYYDGQNNNNIIKMYTFLILYYLKLLFIIKMKYYFSYTYNGY